MYESRYELPKAISQFFFYKNKIPLTRKQTNLIRNMLSQTYITDDFISYNHNYAESRSYRKLCRNFGLNEQLTFSKLKKIPAFLGLYEFVKYSQSLLKLLASTIPETCSIDLQDKFNRIYDRSFADLIVVGWSKGDCRHLPKFNLNPYDVSDSEDSTDWFYLAMANKLKPLKIDIRSVTNKEQMCQYILYKQLYYIDRIINFRMLIQINIAMVNAFKNLKDADPCSKFEKIMSKQEVQKNLASLNEFISDQELIATLRSVDMDQKLINKKEQILMQFDKLFDEVSLALKVSFVDLLNYALYYKDMFLEMYHQEMHELTENSTNEQIKQSSNKMAILDKYQNLIVQAQKINRERN